MNIRRSRAKQPHEEWDRERAWEHLAEVDKRLPGRATEDRRDLTEIARRYDRFSRRGGAVTETDVLASLVVIRALRDKLDDDEHTFMALAREKKVTWARIAKALGMSGRQSAERRFLQLDRACTRVDGSLPHTQSERVEQARDQRSRSAEQKWAYEHARSIRTIAEELVALPNLQQRVDSSYGAHVLSTIHQDVEERVGARSGAKDVKSSQWPRALRECLEEDRRLREARAARDGAGEADAELRKREAKIVHRLLGLITYAGYWQRVNLVDQEPLLEKIRALCEAADIPAPARAAIKDDATKA